MAYGALVSLAQTLDLFLNHDQSAISADAKEKILSIHEYVIFLISFLEDFPEKANRRLEGKIRDVANHTEDIIEDFMWKQIRVSWWTVGLSRVEFMHQLKEVREEIGSIAGEMMDDRLGDLPAPIPSPMLASTGKNDVLIGLDDALMAIKDRLCGESSKLQVIPLVGMGGIGKTTLARHAYNDPLIMDYFHIRVWVTISQDYHEEKVLSSLLDSLELFEEQILGECSKYTKGEKVHKSPKVRRVRKKELGEGSENKMRENVYKSLKGRRYLIVMDDVWSTKAWDDVRNIFPDDRNGSRIMFTTRLSHVAAHPDSSGPPHKMRFMNGDQSWNLLKQKVFTNGQDCPPELEDIGEEIARRCKGLPLAIVLVAGILSVVKTLASWVEIAKNLNSVVDGQLGEILSLSYTNLPPHLKPCFLFIGCFPEDYKIHVSRLIKLWVAEGFLKRQNEYKSLEEEAEEYLEDLVQRNLVLVTSRKTNEKIKSCSLHDMVRDLCIRKAQEEKFVHVMNRYVLPESIKNERRIITFSSHLNYLGPSIHTILCFHLGLLRVFDVINKSFRLLRVLDVINDFEYRSLPSEVFELYHLRYLALGYFVEIPSAISNLENLQTLIICPRTRFRATSCYSYLPLEIWRMRELTHLVLSYYYVLPDPSDGSTLPLVNLKTLSSVASLVCSKSILKMIPNLKKLGITYYRDQEYNLNNLIYLHKLEKLKVTIYRESSWPRQNPTFPRMLKKLTLFGGQLPWKDMTIVGSLPNLEVLKLRSLAYDGDTWETTDGDFLQLRYLLVEKSNLQHWVTESSHFPRLKCLVLHQCLYLRQIPDAIGEIPTLELIEVDDLNNSLVDSAKQIQQDQLQSYGNGALQVRCIRSHERMKSQNERRNEKARKRRRRASTAAGEMADVKTK